MLIIPLFVVLVLITVIWDLRAHGDDTPIALGDATRWSLIYVGVSLAFAGAVAALRGWHAAGLFLTGYLLEKALSVDNLLAFGAVFWYFGIPKGYQHRILHYGIIGAVIFRLLFVLVGTAALTLIGRPVEALFGAFVAWSAWKMFRSGDAESAPIDHASRWYIRWTKRFMPVTADASQNRFFVPIHPMSTAMQATPLLLLNSSQV
jgi:tellurite resistance protein TerC